MTVRVLLVDDEPNQLVTISRILGRHGYDVATAQNGREALARLAEAPVDVMITDLNMPVMDGLALLKEIENLPAKPTTVVLTGYGTIQSAVEAMRHGAADYLIKPCNPDELKLVIERQLEMRALRNEVEHLRREVQRHQRYGALIGDSPAMQDVYRIIEAVSQNKSTVLISGPSGTGKELVARTLHARSPWSKGPFIAVNCGAVSETLLDSQLFGHRRGAFTGAISDQVGVFQAAHGGTLLLDEVSEIPLPLQVKFLRAIQEREIVPLGATRPVKIDIRLVAATNKDLAQEMRAGRFREDLFYRLNVVNIHLPPLRERAGDIPALVDHFLDEFARAYGVAPKRLALASRQRLLEHDWPGNIRELQNAIERAFAISTSDVIEIGEMAPSSASEPAPITAPPSAVTETGTSRWEGAESPDTVTTLDQAERRAIAAALVRARGNKNEAARLLRIDRQRLYRKIEKYNLQDIR